MLQVKLTEVAQEERVVDPEGEVEPNGQAVQMEAPAADPYVLTAQRVQVDAPLVLNEPAAHGRHAALDVPPVPGLYAPAAHAVQDAVAPEPTEAP